MHAIRRHSSQNKRNLRNMSRIKILFSALLSTFLAFGALAQDATAPQFKFETLAASDDSEATLKESLKKEPNSSNANYDLAVF